MGYRAPNTANFVRWPFGYGLSYSTFEYANLSVLSHDVMNGDTAVEVPTRIVHIAVDVQNTSGRAGYEVIQVYSQPPLHPMIWKPRSELIAFTKVWLEPNETRRFGLSVSQRDISGYWNSVSKCWKSLDGSYKVTTGDCAAYLQIEDKGTWNGL
jgi:beta-glucosidase